MRRAQLDYLQQRQMVLQQYSGDWPELKEKAAALQRDIDALTKALARARN